MEYGKPYILNIFTFNNLHGYLVENPIQTPIIRCHIVFLVWFIKRAWAACGVFRTPRDLVPPLIALFSTDLGTPYPRTLHPVP